MLILEREIDPLVSPLKDPIVASAELPLVVEEPVSGDSLMVLVLVVYSPLVVVLLVVVIDPMVTAVVVFASGSVSFFDPQQVYDPLSVSSVLVLN